MKTYTFKDGYKCTSKLNEKELIKRMTRLSWLITLTEPYIGDGETICKKAVKAYNKKENFTGIIRLTTIEKDFLSYCLENEHITENEVETIKYYLKGC